MKIFITLLITISSLFVVSQNYQLVWEDNFDGTTLDSSIWNIEEKEGIWNTGQNAELQFYKTENIEVADDGSGNNCLIIRTIKESINGYSFSSGRVNTNSKMSFTYGKLEARIKIPDLENGLWPAFWTVGYGSTKWPANGEIDIMEMGHDDGIALDSVNSYLSSATHWESGDNRADHNGHILASEDLSDDYHIYSVVWTPEYIRTYLDDSVLVYDFSLTGDDKEEYSDFPNLIIFNTAVGGILPGITSPGNITAPLPAEMYIDYVKLYQLEGEESFLAGPHIVEGEFGVFAEVEPRYSLNSEFDAQIETAGLVESTSPAYGGFKTLSYEMQSSTDFNLAVSSYTVKNMSRYTKGELNFYLKTNYTGDLNISIVDVDGNSSSLTINENNDYNPSRDNTWSIVNLPLSEFEGSVDFSKLITLFSISGASNSESSNIEIDEIYWEEVYTGAPVSSEYYGIYTEHESITAHYDVKNIYVWNGFSVAEESPFYGENVLAYTQDVSTWNGLGLHGEPVDISSYINGNVVLYLKTSSEESFRFGLKNVNDQGWEVNFEPENESVSIRRDGSWNEVTIPIKDFIPQEGSPEISSEVLKNITIPFFFVGTVDIVLDEIYLSKDGSKINFNNTSGIEPGDNADVLIYPNPVNNCLYFSGIKSGAQISIFNLDGSLVETTRYREDTKFDFSSYKSGTYLLRINNEHEIKVRKIVKL